ncbi:MAG: ribbon-helix-helix protein, CopG family [Gemmatimonadaceae bacterium]|nr:ribbon-helix-helix protein, CopG family [Gemmatimonadaceae bacterium]MDQ3517017.1 ribbon-helix-helix protein, CopG family [Gemmatimonadota bacterium]
MDAQITLRISRDLARALARRARLEGVPKSRLVREALRAYMAESAAGLPGTSAERIAAFMGAASLDRRSMASDGVSRRIRRHNWRE